MKPTVVEVDDLQISIKHTLFLTMVDGKVCNILTSTSSQVCFICGASPKDMNKLQTLSKKPLDPLRLKFGLSTLHARIRFFECLLHISYRLEIKCWQVRGALEKEKLQERKKNIISKFRSQMGLIVDQPKHGGGNSNDGNTARRFFESPKLASEVTGIDEGLIFRFSNILNALSSGYDINHMKFEAYCQETAKLYLKLYAWYYMPASVHKILVHGADVINFAILPIGIFKTLF